MSLSGLGRAGSKPGGGVVSVELVRASCFAGAAYDREADRYTSVNTSEPFAAYVFREDCAAYGEESSAASGQPLVKHTLTMEFPAGEASRLAVGQLSGLSEEGFVAKITTGRGECFIAGYSPGFGTRYPLRIASVTSGSGSRPADFPSVTVVLRSEDTEYSKPLRG